MKRFRLLNIFLIMLTMASFAGVMVSCSQDVSTSRVDLDFARLKFVFDLTGLSYSNQAQNDNASFEFSSDIDIADIAYKAVCTSKAGAEGEVLTWKKIYEESKSSDLLLEKSIELEYGTWDFFCIGYDSNGELVCEGEAIGIEVSSSNPVLRITMLPSENDNIENSVILFDIAAPKRSEAYIEVSYKETSEEEYTTLNWDFFVTTFNSNEYGYTDTRSVRFTNDATNSAKTLSLPQGSYEMIVSYYAEGFLWAQYEIPSDVLTILGNSAYTIRGHFNESVFDQEGEGVELGIEVMSMSTQLYVTISGSPASKFYTASIINGDVSSESYSWYVDGIETTNHNKIFTYSPGLETGARTHVISCLCTAMCGGDSIMGSAYVEVYYSLDDLEAQNE